MSPTYRRHFLLVRYVSLLVCSALVFSMMTFGSLRATSAKAPRRSKTETRTLSPQGNPQRQRQPAPRDNSRRVDPIQHEPGALTTNFPNPEELKRRKPEKPEAPAPIPSTIRSPRKAVAPKDKKASLTGALPESVRRDAISSYQYRNDQGNAVRSHHAHNGHLRLLTGSVLPSVSSSPNPAPQSLPNVALNKPATQVSTLNYNPPGDASHAVDGNTDGNYFHASVTHTNGGNQEWWQVDLGASYSLQTINVWNRTDCCGDRLSNFHVLVSDNPFASTDLTATLNQSGVSNYYTAGQGGTPTTLNINRTGRYIRVQLAGSGVILSLAEVEAFGTLAPTNVALNKPATQDRKSTRL